MNIEAVEAIKILIHCTKNVENIMNSSPTDISALTIAINALNKLVSDNRVSFHSNDELSSGLKEELDRALSNAQSVIDVAIFKKQPSNEDTTKTAQTPECDLPQRSESSQTRRNSSDTADIMAAKDAAVAAKDAVVAEREMP